MRRLISAVISLVNCKELKQNLADINPHRPDLRLMSRFCPPRLKGPRPRGGVRAARGGGTPTDGPRSADAADGHCPSTIFGLARGGYNYFAETQMP